MLLAGDLVVLAEDALSQLQNSPQQLIIDDLSIGVLTNVNALLVRLLGALSTWVRLGHLNVW